MADNFYIPMSGSDTGARPWPDTNTPRHWDNDGLKIRTFPNPDDRTRHDDGNTTQVGLETRVLVRVTNRTNAPIGNLRIQACLFPPGYGAMTPDAKWRLFDQASRTDIPASATVDIEVSPSWTPSDTEYQRTSEGHYCMAANVYTTGTNAEGVQLATDKPFEPVTNAHHAQRNLVLNDVSHGPGTSSKVPTTQYPPPGGDTMFRVSTEHVTTKPSDSQLAALVRHPRVVATEEGIARGEVSLSTSGGLVPVTVATEPSAIALRSDLVPGLDTLFSFAPDRPDRIETDLVVDLPKDAPLGSLHTFDIALWTERGDMVGCPLRVMTLVTE
ncbi:hypothetical protein AQF52_0288 [Streptomyces venezuelae]|uniref:hypothetical protein n=1 Tax=Streptomyces gardneri TaxID=66892 RepID=UPI0006BD79A4|nr:hypothetical protein [Streptomyces gardneri]ALO05888.1 hypothetical protein AQF52_0288 [Streptomyces venezuelae]QPK43413.1 hypothetical protein H4W23_01370 [Streptomyces gardneri]WRK34639.1 hypothetical protein U0M97_01375 [Streptomyces venezuelae]CUM43895.1 hypothetical protein BN2537_16755 [Streptomyces venezuelae]